MSYDAHVQTWYEYLDDLQFGDAFDGSHWDAKVSKCESSEDS